MRLVNLVHPDRPDAGAIVTPRGYLPLTDVARAAGAAWPARVDDLLDAGALPALRAWLAANPGAADALPALPSVGRAPGGPRPGPLLRHPRKLLGVGLNYAEHAGDLGERRPEEPATFMKPATTIVGPGDEVVLPLQSERTTGEAELGVVIGRRCRDLDEDDAWAAVAGVTTIIDMTAEDILRRNPRFLTRAKSFDTFLALGPELVTLDEIGDPGALEVRTVLDGVVHRKNVVAHMMFSPRRLVAFFSQVMTLEPGDVISTGTPGAVVLRHGSTIGCAIPGVGEVACPVRDRKHPG
jgi:2-keto-4-pentenoate hydratase/2-oxohepta-3-ene-1,7-dioic acid hydratase in catechol pathway